MLGTQHTQLSIEMKNPMSRHLLINKYGRGRDVMIKLRHSGDLSGSILPLPLPGCWQVRGYFNLIIGNIITSFTVLLWTTKKDACGLLLLFTIIGSLSVVWWSVFMILIQNQMSLLKSWGPNCFLLPRVHEEGAGWALQGNVRVHRGSAKVECGCQSDGQGALLQHQLCI